MPSAILAQLDTYGPVRCDRLDYEQANDYTRRLARSQYENFTVVSWLLPRRLREPFRHVYAFCRWADDLGDETGDTQRSLELQGGVFSALEAARFIAQPYARDAVSLRRWDDLAKVAGRPTPALGHYLKIAASCAAA